MDSRSAPLPRLLNHSLRGNFRFQTLMQLKNATTRMQLVATVHQIGQNVRPVHKHEKYDRLTPAHNSPRLRLSKPHLPAPSRPIHELRRAEV